MSGRGLKPPERCTIEDPSGRQASAEPTESSNSVVIELMKLMNAAGDAAVDGLNHYHGVRDQGVEPDAGVGAEVDEELDFEPDLDEAHTWMDDEFGLPPDYLPEPGLESTGFLTPFLDAGVNMALDATGAEEFVTAAGVQQQRLTEAAGAQPLLDLVEPVLSDPVVGDISILMGLGGANAIARKVLAPKGVRPGVPPPKGARGGAVPRVADDWGTHTGKASDRAFFPENAGGPIEPLSTEKIRVTDRGIDVVDRHTARFGDDPANQAMAQRLRKIAAGELEPTPQDLNFYSHELREFVRYRKKGYPDGLPDDFDQRHKLWNDTHTATLEDYGLQGTLDELYHPDAKALVEQ